MKSINSKKKPAVKKSGKTTGKKIVVNKNEADSSSGSSKLFTIVAIGASAGGLEAYTKIIANLLPDTGMAFVIIQHLSADYKSLLKDILKHRTQMPVISVTNRMKPQPNKIYISPPTSTISFSNGIFKLKTRPKDHFGYKPIDDFMQSLAEDNTHFAIGIILSGSDSDGIIGMEHIKSTGGITYAQNQQTSKFFTMPKKSIDSGAVDFVLSPEAIAKELNRISYNEHIKHDLIDKTGGKLDEHLGEILSLILARKNIDFRHYKPATLRRRILRRIVMNNIKNVTGYVEYLKKNPSEIDALSSDILIKVTKFFRDPEMYKALKKDVFPKIFTGGRNKKPVRFWVTACSTGQETYSMAISIAEFLGQKMSGYNIQIFSTDLNEAGIEKARTGIYSGEIKDDVSEQRLKKFFRKSGSNYIINKNIRKLCVFAKQNFINDPPFSKIDLISCRNVLIYMSTELQKKVIPVFHYALKDGCYLVLGYSESIGKWAHMFDVTDRKNKIYSKKQITFKTGHEYLRKELLNLEPAKLTGGPANVSSGEFQNDVEHLIKSQYTPTGVVINKNFEILHYKGDIQPYLEIKDGAPTYDLLKLIRKEIAQPLEHLFTEALKKNRTVRKNNIRCFINKEWKNINIVIDPIFNNSVRFRSYFVLFETSGVFAEVKSSGAASVKDTVKQTELNRISRDLVSRKKELVVATEKQEETKEELQSSKEELIVATEKQEETKEELQTSNEELQTANEELQSSNEELETMKEELQSTNEELITVNEELRVKNIDLSLVNSDLINILNSIRLSIVIVDNHLRIKKFTKDAGKLLNIIQSDTGRKITDLHHNVIIKNLRGLLKEVIETPEIKILEVRDNKNAFYSMRIRPYKTGENKIDGAIITFVDISEIKTGVQKLTDLQNETKKITNNLEHIVKKRTKSLELINVDLTSEIQDRKEAEFSLKKLSRNLIDTQEIERLKLSHDLHDSVNQLLSIAKLKVHNVEINIKKDPTSAAHKKDLSDAKDYIFKAIDEVRRLSKDLRPPALDDLGITVAIRGIIEDFKLRTTIKNISFTTKSPLSRFSGEIELALYRILQESLHNIEKHSQAGTVKITLNQNKSELILIVSDNGKGFIRDKSSLNSLKKFGLIGIKERAESIGGKFFIKSVKGLGTKIEVRIPLNFKNKKSNAKENKNTVSR